MALDEWAAVAAPRWSEDRRRGLLARLGWLGPTVPTLEKIGEELTLTRERVRQLQVKLEKRLAMTRPPNSDAFETAVAALRDASDEVGEPAGSLLAALGLTERPLSDKGLALLFDLLGRTDVFAEFQRRYELTRPRRRETVVLAKGLTRSVGVACVEWACVDGGTDPASVRSALQSEGWCRFLDEDWFWDPATPPGRNRLVNVTVKVLAACGPQSVHELRDALDRMHRWGRLPHLPSAGALRLFYRAHPYFAVDEGDAVRATRPLDPMVELDDVERTLFEILRAAPGGVLDRSEFLRRAIAAGVNQNTFGVYSSYSPILDNPIQDCWVLRGSDVSPAVLEAARLPRPRRFRDESWLPSGLLRVVRELGQEWGVVVSLPRAYARLVAGRSFVAATATGESAGIIRVNNQANSWGYGQFLQDQRAMEGDALVADFDIAAGSCVLSLVRRDDHAHPGLEASRG